MRRFFLFGLFFALAAGIWAYDILGISAFPNQFDDRSTAERINDARIFSRILVALKEKKESLPVDVNVDVWEGRVLLTGIVDDSKYQDFAADLGFEVKGIKKVYNHIQVAKKEVVERRQVGRSGKELKKVLSDKWVTNKIRVRLFSEKASVKSANYRYRAVLGHAYVIGFARNAKEKKDALQVIRETPSVQGVTEYIEIFKGE
jgi:osmotically-inducible protein OsmY